MRAVEHHLPSFSFMPTSFYLPLLLLLVAFRPLSHPPPFLPPILRGATLREEDAAAKRKRKKEGGEGPFYTHQFLSPNDLRFRHCATEGDHFYGVNDVGIPNKLGYIFFWGF